MARVLLSVFHEGVLSKDTPSLPFSHYYSEIFDPMRKRIKLGLALGGGGARGLAHIGVLKND